MPLSILKQYWGYDAFRPMQREIIDSVLDGHDTLGLLPTGGGKSITFQVPALLLPGLTIVVTPLISLMKDQVDNLKNRDIRAVYFHSGLTRREANLGLTRCRLGKVKLVYVSPERLQNDNFIAELRSMDVSLIVVDEAHCISQWGYDFRPSYLKVAKLREITGEHVPILALTASATPEVTADIMRSLRFREPRVFARSFTRENLSYIVRYADFKEETLLRVLNATSGCAIVYVRSRRRCREIAQLLTREGISADYYHAGLAPEDKELRQNAWKNDHIRVIVATNAFGMGIDKPDVRTVVHYDLPSSLEEYYQEAGRAGRDGKESFAVVIASSRDKATLSRRLSESFPEKDFISHVYELAGNFLNVAVGDGYGQLYEFSLENFCHTYSLPPIPTQSALHLLSRAGYIEYIEETTSTSRLMIIMKKEELYGLEMTTDAEEVFQCILRTYTGLFADYVPISELTIARSTMLSTETVYQTLLYLTRLHAIHYIPRRTTPYMYYTTSRELPKHVILPLEVYEHQRERMRVRLDAMKEFVFSATECRAKGMLRYFGEKDPQDCGKCDVCRARRSKNRPMADSRENLRKTIVYRANQPEGCEVTSLLRDIAEKRENIIAEIRHLADTGEIIIDGCHVRTKK
ncbi:ATP-dependent DNA helicase RecQ [uncultured Duncaniella sp.]|jgi:ATP-dependent DNA helicase RecQ|uniref:RecQ family ATP-dependent DNA helicase n=1 Tax=uncultured Duncaniella sp. TaxID=2768039 RepID=UPI000F481899|nr:ATP-dependent DNA helicase RecQ [uncultured Duncaniella sp.]ROS89093.1 RecQ family ATP-dependent DNA helicase [Muribaculaceae bacterium Isolate-080 (Janvier)]